MNASGQERSATRRCRTGCRAPSGPVRLAARRAPPPTTSSRRRPAGTSRSCAMNDRGEGRQRGDGGRGPATAHLLPRPGGPDRQLGPDGSPRATRSGSTRFRRSTWPPTTSAPWAARTASPTRSTTAATWWANPTPATAGTTRSSTAAG